MYTATVRITAKEGKLYCFEYITGLNPWFATPADNSVFGQEAWLKSEVLFEVGQLGYVDVKPIRDKRLGTILAVINLRRT